MRSRSLLLAIATLALVILPRAAGATTCSVSPDGTQCYANAADCPHPGLLACPTARCESTPGCPGNVIVAPLSAPAPAAAPPSATDLPFTQVKPTIHFAPPGFSFSDLVVRKLGGGVAVVDVPWIGQYIAAAYRYAIPAASLLVVVVIMIAGIRWMVSGGGGGKAVALGWIRNAVLGLALLLGSYVILRLVNPDLVRLNGIQVRIAAREEFIPESEPDEVSGSEPVDLVPPSNAGIGGTALFERALAPDLLAAGAAVTARGYSITVTSGYRSIDQQRALIAENCQNPPGSATCNPKSGRPTTCILRNGPASCPHTTGRAVDVWGTKNGAQCISQATCLADKTACRALPCQTAVIAAMRSQGFCNLASEPWHFEKPKMSASCN